MGDTQQEAEVSCEINVSPTDLVSFVPWACNQLQAPFTVKINTRIQEEYVSKIEAQSKRTKKAASTLMVTSQDSRQLDVESIISPGDESYSVIELTIVNDNHGHVIEIHFSRCRPVPQLLIKVFALCIPYQVNLIRLSFHSIIKLDGSVLYEIGKLLPASNITELIFDYAPVRQKNYGMILETTKVKRLSLNHCNIDDDDCAVIAEKLCHSSYCNKNNPASTSLLILSLASNRITSKGAFSFANALRTNRCLQYLNLSGNYVDDEGATAILKMLMKFPLTNDEVLIKRQCLLDYLILKRSIYAKFYKELSVAFEKSQEEQSQNLSKKKSLFRSAKASALSNTHHIDPIALKADAMTINMVGIYSDPFKKDFTTTQDDVVYSTGNFTLCYLNLAFNNMGYITVAKIFQVMSYQNEMINKPGTGLVHIIIEGNKTPETCAELVGIINILEQIVSVKQVKAKRVKSKSTKSSSTKLF